MAYMDLGNAWIAAGPPISTPEDQMGLLLDFIGEAKRRRIRALLFGAPPALAHDFASAADGHSALHLGEIPHWDLRRWGQIPARREFFSQVRRAERKAVVVREVPRETAANPISDFRRQANSLFANWVASRPMAPLGFMATALPFHLCQLRRYFGAYRAGQLIAFAAASPVYARNGWFLENVIRSPSAPNGSVENLLATIFDTLRQEHYHYATLGMVPLATHDGGTASQPAWARAAFAFSRANLEKLYHFQGLQHFKEKLAPDHWTPQYLLGEKAIGPFDVMALLRAFAGKSLLRYTLATAKKWRR